MSDKTVVLTKKEIGEAITHWIGMFKEGCSFFPYHISGTDTELHIPDTVMFQLDLTPRGSKCDDYPHNI